MKKLFIILFCFIIKVNLFSNEKFVIINNNKFYIDSCEYYYIGFNYWQGPYLAADYVSDGRKRLIRELDLMYSYGIRNLRIMASCENSSMIKSLKPTYQEFPGVYNEKLLDGLDFLLYEMNKRNMKAVLVLNNYWQWTGGMSQYNSWTLNGYIVDPDLNNNYYEFMKYSAEFYSNKKANELFQKYIYNLLNRYNKYSKIVYKDDPCIMSWQLANEPRPHPESLKDSTKQKVFIDWIEKSAKYIRSIDKNHLISTGNEGLAGCLWDSSMVVKLNSIPFIDYITVHLWPRNWRWFNGCLTIEKFDSLYANTSKYLDFHINISEKLQKPLVLEEFGIDRDSCTFSPNSITTVRDKFFKSVFLKIEEYILNNKGFCGSNIWTWAGEGRPLNQNDYTGDPPQETKGLNSVYDNDISTLNVIKDHYNKLEKLKN